MLSVLTGGDRDAYVQGINDHVSGNEKWGLMSVQEKMQKGKFARNALIVIKMQNDNDTARCYKRIFNDHEFHDKYFRYFGYASISKPEEVIPDVSISFYSFHFMVILGFLFIMIFSTALYLLFNGII